MSEFLKTTFERLVTEETLPKLYHDTVWVLGIAIVAILFHKPIKALIGRIMKHKGSFGEWEFSNPPEALSKFPSPEKAPAAGAATTNPNPVATTPNKSIEYYKTAHFYWLGSDLMEASRNVALNWDKENIRRPLRQSLRHFRKAGLKDRDIEARLEWLIDVASKKLMSEWNEQARKDIFNEIVIIWKMLKDLVDREAGPQFKPFED